MTTFTINGQVVQPGQSVTINGRPYVYQPGPQPGHLVARPLTPEQAQQQAAHLQGQVAQMQAAAQGLGQPFAPVQAAQGVGQPWAVDATNNGYFFDVVIGHWNAGNILQREPTEEEKAATVRMVADMRRRQEEFVQQEKVERRALHDILPPTEQERLATKGFIWVPGRAGRVWQLWVGGPGVYVCIYLPRENRCQGICVQVRQEHATCSARGRMMYLWLLADEPHVYKTGNKHGFGAPAAILPADREAMLEILSQAEARWNNAPS